MLIYLLLVLVLCSCRPYVALAYAAIGGIIAGVQGTQQRAAEKRGASRMRQAQRDSEVAAAAEQRRAAMEERRANAAAPDVASLLASEQELSKQTTLLTGVRGKNRLGNPEGGSTLLGE